MGLRIINKTISPTGKRVDFQVRQTGLFIEPVVYTMRFVAGSELPSGEDFIEEVEYIIAKKKSWKQAEKCRVQRLSELNGNAFILKEEYPDREPEVTEPITDQSEEE